MILIHQRMKVGFRIRVGRDVAGGIALPFGGRGAPQSGLKNVARTGGPLKVNRTCHHGSLMKCSSTTRNPSRLFKKLEREAEAAAAKSGGNPAGIRRAGRRLRKSHIADRDEISRENFVWRFGAVVVHCWRFTALWIKLPSQPPAVCMSRMQALDMLANNLANATTGGFKTGPRILQAVHRRRRYRNYEGEASPSQASRHSKAVDRFQPGNLAADRQVRWIWRFPARDFSR